YLADAQAYHKGGGTSEQVKATRLFYSLRSRIQYGYKHFGWFSATLLLAGTLFLEFMVRIIFAIGKCSKKQVKETVWAYCLLWRFMPHFFSKGEHKLI
ncbi:hypothetical protein M1N64_05190, partial [Peptococcaceae bacterium]|nr:hypothetical protein [Peptococcaceae bacterium]